LRPSPRVDPVALDERGKPLDSRAFADRIAAWRDTGTKDLAVVIGGADGLGPAVLQKADLRLAFGAMTWPHQIVRILLAEQLYRVVTILRPPITATEAPGTAVPPQSPVASEAFG
jgi:23S rRNA (pseudouridine1915-N3)-methyltransferase